MPKTRELVLQNPRRYPEAQARRLRPWLIPLLDALVPGGESFTLRFVSDREMRRLNAGFRGKDKTTDVLSFPGDPSFPGEGVGSGAAGEDSAENHLGDVVISVPTARRQAAERGHTVARELKVLTLHGVLHCLGYDHEKDRGEMTRLEARLRRRWIGDE